MNPLSALRLLVPLLAATQSAPAAAAPLPIGQVQGAAASSPLAGQPVQVTGTVSADFRDGLGGLYVQDGGDGDPATSDALFVPAADGFAFPGAL